jgi:ABC-type nickel/cobalt efflux system permease component RcnA
MDLRQLGTLYLFACWHVLLPGHGKTLLAAVCISGGRRLRLLRVAAGYSLSHGIMMGLAAMSGLLLADRLAHLAGRHGLLIKNLVLPILLLVGLHFAVSACKGMRRHGTEHTPPRNESGDHAPADTRLDFAHKRPFLTGLAVGVIPYGDVLGLVAISPMLVKAHENLLAAGTIVWLGVTTTVMAIATALRILPTDRLTKRIPDWLAYGVAALICFAVLAQRGWTIWRDYTLLYR